MNLGLSARTTRAVVLATAVVLTPLQAFADASAAFYDRSFMLAANEKCRLFEPDVASALTASTLQARGAAIRAGAPEGDLAQTAGRARVRAAGTDCSNPELEVVRDRVATAFAGWSKTRMMTFPGGWGANRSGFSSPTWRLSQARKMGKAPIRFGFAARGERPESLAAVVSFVGRPRPYAARLVLRDPSLLPRPWVAAGQVAALPPEAARQSLFATTSGVADKTLLSEGHAEGQAWIFPAASADVLARLDPRESFVIEFLFRDDSVASATFEAGDFAAGRAFIAMGAL